MSNNVDTKMVPSEVPLFSQKAYAWMISTFILTPLAAAVLAITGFLPTSPMIAAIDGLLVSFMYVGFRVVNAMRCLRLYKHALAQEQNTESVIE